MDTANEDGSNGFELVANIYIARRGTRSHVCESIGATVVKAWADAFPHDAVVLDLGSGPVARALEPQGRFLFTAPRQRVEWLDAMTGQRSQSLGKHTYERLLRDAGLTWVASAHDEGKNHYYFAEKW